MIDLQKYSVTSLKKIARHKRIRGYSGKKEHIIQKLSEHSNIPEVIKELNLKPMGNTETIGMTTEYMICQYAGILFVGNISRVNMIFVDKFYTTLKENLDNILIGIEILEHIGSKNGSVDFKLNNGTTLSVKSNYSGDKKVCPQKIGQPTLKKFSEHFSKFSQQNMITNKEQVRQIIETYYHLMLKEYFNYLFCCDKFLWIYYDKTKLTSVLLSNNEMQYKYLNHENLKLHKGSNKTDWNSAQIIYDNNKIGEFQIHNNRDCIKFRFYMLNLNKILLNDFTSQLTCKNILN